MIKLIRDAAIASVLSVSIVSGAHGQETALPAQDSPEVRVVNNHHYRIRVVLVDEQGTHHSLGRVAPSKAEIFEPSSDLVDGARFQIKVFADEPVWSAGNTGEAIRSQDLEAYGASSVYVWVEPDLTRSQITVGR